MHRGCCDSYFGSRISQICKYEIYVEGVSKDTNKVDSEELINIKVDEEVGILEEVRR